MKQRRLDDFSVATWPFYIGKFKSFNLASKVFFFQQTKHVDAFKMQRKWMAAV
jgi:hypothetical protein